jgi:hypothetical protein
MVRWYPEDLVGILGSRYPPERVHSIVLMTKFPEAVLTRPLAPVLGGYDQVVVQVTVTGLGGTDLEPGVPEPEVVLSRLEDLIDFTGRPERVLLRFDPVLHWRPAGESRRGARGSLLSNLPLFAETVRKARAAGVTVVKTSLVTPYPKVVRRFKALGLELVPLSGRTREEVLSTLEAEAAEAGVNLEFCCEPTRTPSACVDAHLLTRLHPRGLPARPDKAAGQRPHCRCAHAVDLAWYSSHPCPSGCLYCYANPTGTTRLPARRGSPRASERGRGRPR